MKITKAVIPAAGLGTRVLPASKSVPKEMLNIVDKPAIQYIVEEAVDAGITDILIITNRGKEAIENHFDYSMELESQLQGRPEKQTMLNEVRKVANLANIYFLRQKDTKGLGHAVLCARAFVGNEPFAVLYGDDVIVGKPPVTKQLMEAYELYGQSTVGVNEVPKSEIQKYCSLQVQKRPDGTMECTDMVEKPQPDEIMSLYSILGRCVLTPDIFDILEVTPKGVGGEIQLTDAMRILARTRGMTAVDFVGRRYDLGSKIGILQANVEVALEHPEVKDAFKKYIIKLAEELQ